MIVVDEKGRSDGQVKESTGGLVVCRVSLVGKGLMGLGRERDEKRTTGGGGGGGVGVAEEEVKRVRKTMRVGLTTHL